MSTRGSVATPLAISTSCCFASDRDPTRSRAETPASTSRRIASARRSVARRSMRPGILEGASLPRKMFSATDSSGTKAEFLMHQGDA